MNISILLRHARIWENDVRYERYKSDGIVVGQNISYDNLKAAIAVVLEIDIVRKNLIMRYVVEGSERDTQALAMVESNLGDSCYIPELEVVNYIKDPNNKEVKVNQLYKDKTTLVSVMAKYKIEHSFNFRVKRSDKQSYVLECHSNDCGWELKASCWKKSNVFKMRYFNDEHTCPLRDRILTKVQATVRFVSGVTTPKLINHKRIYTPNDIIDDIQELYGVDYQQAWRAKERALETIRGKPAEGYKKLPRYIYMLNIVYPNLYIRMHKSEKNQFMYLFISLRPMMRGFEFCRPIVVVDGAHLGRAYKGTFVSASTLDGAGCILSLAYEIVDTENDCSWTWFFEQFKSAFGEHENRCVVSDRNESIMKSVSIVYPNFPHCACIWHLWKNVCKNFRRSKNTLSDLFYSMAKANRREDFEKLMAKVGKVDHRVKEYLEDARYEKWSRVHATVNRGRMMTSNIVECINGCLVEARQLPILDFLEEVRILFGSSNCKNKEIASYTKETLGRRFEDILIVNASKSSRMKVVPSSQFIFSVYDAGRRYIVCLERKTCNCGRFQVDEIPCAHAIAVLRSKNITDMHPYCSHYYKPDALASTYEVSIVPMPDKEDWLVPESVLDEIVLPPRFKRMPGRPKK